MCNRYTLHGSAYNNKTDPWNYIKMVGRALHSMEVTNEANDDKWNWIRRNVWPMGMCGEAERSLGPATVTNSCRYRYSNTRDNSWYIRVERSWVMHAEWRPARIKNWSIVTWKDLHEERLDGKYLKKDLWLRNKIMSQVKPYNLLS